MMRRLVQLLILFVTLILSSGAWATTYYIDWVNGADTNDGLTKSTPWKRAPGMVGCTSNCATVATASLKPGDSVILKGGVTWPNSVLGWILKGNGSSTTSIPGCTGQGCIYIGVDKTWYTGASWARPILNAQGKLTGTDAGGIRNYIVRMRMNYAILDNIEFTGLYWDATVQSGSNSNNTMLILDGGSPGLNTNLTLKNLYFHGWSHDTYANGARVKGRAIYGDTATPNLHVNSVLQDSIVDGSDTADNSISGIFGSPPYILRNYISNVCSAMITNGSVKISGNTIKNFGGCFDWVANPNNPGNAHSNGIESNVSNNQEVSNNLMMNGNYGAVGLWIAPNDGYTVDVFNNIIADHSNNQHMIATAPVNNNNCPMTLSTTYCDYAGSVNIYNNTIEAGPDADPQYAGMSISTKLTAANIRNNHIITRYMSTTGGVYTIGSAQSYGMPTTTASNNLVQSKSVANDQGYSISSKFPFRAGGATLGVGINLHGLPGMPSGAGSTTSCGVAYDQLSHSIIGPYLTPVPRGTKWDVGAYQYPRIAPIQTVR